MKAKITVFIYSPSGDGYHYQVRVNDKATHTDFEDIKDARAAAFVEACKASITGNGVTVEEVKAG